MKLSKSIEYNAQTGETTITDIIVEEIEFIEGTREPTLEDRVVTLEETVDVLFGGGE